MSWKMAVAESRESVALIFEHHGIAPEGYQSTFSFLSGTLVGECRTSERRLCPEQAELTEVIGSRTSDNPAVLPTTRRISVLTSKLPLNGVEVDAIDFLLFALSMLKRGNLDVRTMGGRCMGGAWEVRYGGVTGSHPRAAYVPAIVFKYSFLCTSNGTAYTENPMPYMIHVHITYPFHIHNRVIKRGNAKDESEPCAARRLHASVPFVRPSGGEIWKGGGFAF